MTRDMDISTDTTELIDGMKRDLDVAVARVRAEIQIVATLVAAIHAKVDVLLTKMDGPLA